MPATRGTLVESRNSYTVLLHDETLTFLFLFLKFFLYYVYQIIRYISFNFLENRKGTRTQTWFLLNEHLHQLGSLEMFRYEGVGVSGWCDILARVGMVNVHLNSRCS